MGINGKGNSKNILFRKTTHKQISIDGAYCTVLPAYRHGRGTGLINFRQKVLSSLRLPLPVHVLN